MGDGAMSAINELLERYRVDVGLRDSARAEVETLRANLDEAVALLRGMLDPLNQDDEGGYFICEECKPEADAAYAFLARLDSKAVQS
jgi:hypothetical protein